VLVTGVCVAKPTLSDPSFQDVIVCRSSSECDETKVLEGKSNEAIETFNAVAVVTEWSIGEPVELVRTSVT
jgi:hypothetical protein